MTTEQQKGEEQWVELGQTVADGGWAGGEEGEGDGSVTEEEEIQFVAAVEFAEWAN